MAKQTHSPFHGNTNVQDLWSEPWRLEGGKEFKSPLNSNTGAAPPKEIKLD